jgi:energy-coupling factor transport system ATP-binding protein
MITFEHVSYSYPQASQPALRDINLSLATGSLVAVVGANGSGKTTLCAAIAGFVPHHFRGELSGHVRIDELDTSAATLAELTTRVGFVFQNPFNQLSGAKLTVAEEVAFGLENLGVPTAEMGERVAAALAVVGLSALAERSPYDLSGGEMQRLALASILVMQPRVLVLDEPTAQLDPVGAQQVFAAIRSLVEACQITVVLAEHNAEHVAQFADRVLALDGGAVVLDGTPAEVLTSDRLEEVGVSVSRYTLAARAAREVGRWPGGRPLPIRLEEAVRGFRDGLR